jgi:predicted transcriptional regulator
MDITLRLSDEQGHTLTSLARADGVSEHDAAVRAIEAAAHERRSAQVRALSRDGRERYASLLDRLSK